MYYILYTILYTINYRLYTIVSASRDPPTPLGDTAHGSLVNPMKGRLDDQTASRCKYRKASSSRNGGKRFVRRSV